MTRPILLLALAFLPMLIEARRSMVNERRLRAAGAIEARGDVHAIMQFAYPACFIGMTTEGWLTAFTAAAPLAGAAVFAGGKALKYWAIQALGPRWTFRVLVPPHSVHTMRGPYRFLRHPNYLGVVGELAGFALLAGATYGGLISIVGFGMLMLVRIRVEERALGLRA